MRRSPTAGERVSGTLAEPGAPVGIQEVDAGTHALPDGSHRDVNRVETSRCCPRASPRPRPRCSRRCSSTAPARAAAIGQFAAGKTGTTSNYGDAWFVGWDSKYTVAVWVGYPNKLIPMTTDFNGSPVLGGTFPALIWHDFMISAMQIDKARAEQAARARGRQARTTRRPRARAAKKRSRRHRGASGAGAAARRPRRAKSARATARPGRRATAPRRAANRRRAAAPVRRHPTPTRAADARHAAPSEAPTRHADPPAGARDARAAPPRPRTTGGVSPGG